MNNKSNINQILTTDKDTVIKEYERKSTRSNYQSEEDMEKLLIKQLSSLGYEYLKDVKDEESLIKNLRAQIEKVNSYKFSENEWNSFFNQYIANNQDDIKKKTEKIQNDYIYNLRLDNGQNKNIYILDKKNIYTNNYLQVINQYVNNDGKYKNRYDVTILVNGIPMIHIELKRRGIDIREAFNQIARYSHDSFSSQSGLFNFIQLFVISNGTSTKYYSNTVRELHIKNSSNQNIKSKTSHSYEFTNYWSDARNRIIEDIEDFANTFFAKHTILNILCKYCVFNSESQLLVMRPYQIAATERIINQINISHNNPKRLSTKDAGGFIWHTTGSGKTLTSFKCAQLAKELDYIDKVLFVVDRKDLDYQTMKEYDRFEKGCANSNTSTTVLQQQLESSDTKIIITTIQKLSIFIKKNPRHSVYQKHVVIIFDECHRSQFGDMHSSITNSFKKYNIFGFTGTPIFSKNAANNVSTKTLAAKANEKRSLIVKTTEQLFGNCLHKYTIVNAIEDHNVLPFRYSEYETFKMKDNVIDEKVHDIDKDNVWNDPKRIQNVTKYILDNFNTQTRREEAYVHSQIKNIKNVARDKRNKTEQKIEKVHVKGFNSIFAVSSIEAAKLYYTEFKKQLASRDDLDLRIATIFSFSPNEKYSDVDETIYEENNESVEGLDKSSREFLDGAINDYNNMFNTAYDSNGDNFQNYYRDVSMRLKNKEIDILIVVNMFLTGFDATTLNTLWVDKWLQMHGLIQAFSRTNRILNSIKKFGNIISFRHLDNKLKEAIALFSDENASGLILIRSFKDYYEGYKNNRDDFEPGYKQLINSLLNQFPIDKRITSEEKQKEFIRLFGKILQVRNILISFSEFRGKELLNDGQLQDYLSRYQECYEEFKEKAKADKKDITDDLVFEIELIKQTDINVDYIQNLIYEYHLKNVEEKKVREAILKATDASYELRSKKDLIIKFLERLYSEPKNLNDIESIIEVWNESVKDETEFVLNKIINDNNLNEEETRKFINACFKNGELKTIGSDFNKILPKISRFDKSNKYIIIKNKVMEELLNYFNMFYNIVPIEESDSL